jgi:UDPglucose 6-dehydrogenase
LEGSSKKSYPKDFGMCVNPEFLREGSAVEDFMGPERVVIGVEDERSKDTMLQIYGWCTAPKIFTNLRTAEMIKYASNAFLASRISLSNELANICKALGVDWYQVAEAVGLDRRIGPHYLEAGLGFGGSCLPKDARALIALARRLKLEPEMLKATLRVNDKQPVRAVSLAEESLHNLKGKKVGILGLSFKPNTDDVRESRSIVVIEELLRRGASILAHDPKAMENMKKIFPNITYTGDPQRVIDESDAVIIATKWPEYEHLDYRDKIVIDGRRIMKAKAEARIYQGLCW